MNPESYIGLSPTRIRCPFRGRPRCRSENLIFVDLLFFNVSFSQNGAFNIFCAFLGDFNHFKMLKVSRKQLENFRMHKCDFIIGPPKIGFEEEGYSLAISSFFSLTKLKEEYFEN
jgi:hypothetical protein